MALNIDKSKFPANNVSKLFELARIEILRRSGKITNRGNLVIENGEYKDIDEHRMHLCGPIITKQSLEKEYDEDSPKTKGDFKLLGNEMKNVAFNSNGEVQSMTAYDTKEGKYVKYKVDNHDDKFAGITPTNPKVTSKTVDRPIDGSEIMTEEQGRLLVDMLLEICDFPTTKKLTKFPTTNDSIQSGFDSNTITNFLSKLSSEAMTGESSSCRSVCTGLCVGTCGSECTGTCGDRCTGCTGACLNSCLEGCLGCSDDCGDSCISDCTKGCADKCKGMCTVGCDNSCVESCKGTCKIDCDGECIGCTGSCKASCTGGHSGKNDGYTCGCGGSCTSGCGFDCNDSCRGFCNTSCSGCTSCSTTCEGSCEGTTSSSTNPIDPPNPGCPSCTGCAQNCASMCTGYCGGCSSSCWNGCRTTCTGNCGGSACKDSCTGDCKGTCELVCANSNSGSCIAPTNSSSETMYCYKKKDGTMATYSILKKK